jgi:hypothetical protein
MGIRVHYKKQREPLERFFVLDIALAYVFLHLWLEATIDRVTQELFSRSDYTRMYDYKNRRMYLKERIDFLFSTFCSELQHKELVKLLEMIRPLIIVRNSIIHLEEISWRITLFDDKPPLGTPIKNAEHLTVENLKRQYDKTRDFFSELKIVLNKAFNNQSIDVEYVKGEEKEIKKENLIDYVFHNTVFNMPEFDSINSKQR